LWHFAGEFVAFAGSRRLIATLGLMLLAGLMEGISLALLVPLLAALTASEGGTIHMLADGFFSLIGAGTPFARLASVVAMFALAMVVRAWVLMLREKVLARLQLKYIEHRRLQLLRSVAGAEWSRVASLRHARVTSAITSEIARVATAAYGLLRIAVAGIMLAVQLALTLAVSWQIGLIALALLVVAAGAFGTRLRFANLYGGKLSKRSLSLVDTAGQLLGGLKQAAAENGQQRFIRDFAATGSRLVEEQLHHQRQVARFHFAVAVFSAFAGCVVLLVGAGLEGDTVALLAALLILTRMTTQAVGIQRDAELLAAALPAHATLQELEAELTNASEAAAPADAPPPTGPIRLEGVTYLHEQSAGVRDLSLVLDPGEIVGVTGPSGAGKTTFIDLVAGLVRPQQGEVRIGPASLDGAMAKAWRDRIAYVAQDAYLTNSSIRDNLAAAAGGAGDQAIWNALTLVAVADTVRAMPDGLNTLLSERGSRLSGGERQRIALARAILRRPALLILDEATNAIDVDTEHRILAELARLDPEMTILIVAHRRETLRHCTRILSIEDGRLVGDQAA
jgi:ATP-binding cassette subfamily C protein